MTLREAADSLGVTQRRIVVERVDRHWLVMWPDGTVEGFPTRASVLRAIRRTASGDVDIATVRWSE